jgi:hypothetical protein
MEKYAIHQVDLSKKKEVNLFLGLPQAIYKNNPFWVPPLRVEALQMLNPKKNPFFSRSSAVFFLAVDHEEKPVARLASLHHVPYNNFNNEKTAFFYLFESLPLDGVAVPLFEAAYKFARQRGLNKIIGPKGFSTLDGVGLLTEGFNYLPAFGIPYNPPYYPQMVEEAGFTKTGDILSGFMEQGSYVDPKIEVIAKRVHERHGINIMQFRTRADLKMILPNLQQLYNDAIKGTQGNYPLTNEDVRAIANQMLWFADPTLIKVIVKDSRPIGFLFAYPDISKAVQQSRGRLFPFGWYHILKELHTTTRLDINGAGIIDEFRGLGGTAILFNEIVKSTAGTRYTQAEIVQIGENNQRMLQEAANLGIIFHKKHSFYSRKLD